MIKSNFCCFLFIPLFCHCQNVVYSKVNTSAGSALLTLNSDNSYDYRWYRYYDVGPIEDTISHQGKWKKNGDTLILNSYSSPNNYDFFKINNQSFIKSDSMKIVIKSFDNDPLFLFSPGSIRINDIYYDLPPPNGDSIQFTLVAKKINYIILPGYPIFRPQNQNFNYFSFSIKQLLDFKYKFPSNTYFLNEKFLLKGDCLFQIVNNEVDSSQAYRATKK